jgi:hypothetical protein
MQCVGLHLDRDFAGVRGIGGKLEAHAPICGNAPPQRRVGCPDVVAQAAHVRLAS